MSFSSRPMTRAGAFGIHFIRATGIPIYQLAREQLKTAAQELEVSRHAETGAKSVLAALFASSGYTVTVEFVPIMKAETQ